MEDLSKLKPQAALFQQHARPVLWTNLEELQAEVEEDQKDAVQPTQFAFGYWAGDVLCLIPLQAEDPRTGYWRSPVCATEDDAKRNWFIIQKLLDALDGDL